MTLISYGMYKILHSDVSRINVELPSPTGSFQTGFVTIELTDSSRKENYSDDPLHPYRELVIDVWYPVDKEAIGTKADFFGSLSPYVKTDLSVIEKKPIEAFSTFDDLKSHSLINVVISNQDSSYPVIIISPGFGSPARLYASLCEELASQGYIVFALNYPYVTSPVAFQDGRVVKPTKKFEQLKSDKTKKDQATLEEMEIWIVDMSFVIDQLVLLNKNDTRFAGKLNLNKIGVCGHSLGGAAVINLSRKDNRIKACCNLDGRLRGDNAELGFATPLMILLSDRKDEASQKETESLKRLVDVMHNNAYMFMIKNTNHGSFTNFDDLTGKTTEDSRLKFSIITRLISNFFNVYLKQEDAGIILSYVKDHHDVISVTLKNS